MAPRNLLEALSRGRKHSPALGLGVLERPKKEKHMFLVFWVERESHLTS